jgi:hypothetical protein
MKIGGASFPFVRLTVSFRPREIIARNHRA